MEEHIAHLQRSVDELSDVVARQQSEIAVLARRVRLLIEREADREGDAGGGYVFGEETPPHW